MIRRPPISTLFPYPPLFRSCLVAGPPVGRLCPGGRGAVTHVERRRPLDPLSVDRPQTLDVLAPRPGGGRELIEPGQGGPGRFLPRARFFKLERPVLAQVEDADQGSQAQPLQDERGQDHGEGDEDDLVAKWEWRARR